MEFNPEYVKALIKTSIKKVNLELSGLTVYTEVASGDIREGQEIVVESLSRTNAVAPTGPPRMF